MRFISVSCQNRGRLSPDWKSVKTIISTFLGHSRFRNHLHGTKVFDEIQRLEALRDS